MAKQMPFTTSDGVDHPNSYWAVMEITIRPLAKKAFFSFHGWHDKAAKDAGASYIASKNYWIRDLKMEQFFHNNVLKQFTPARMAYQYAMAEPDEHGSKFFQGAQDV